MFTNKKNILVVPLLLFQALNCTSYKAKPLEILSVSSENAKTVSFNYNIFNRSSCAKYLGREKVIDKGFQPIQICLTNNTNKHFIFSLDTFNVTCIDPETVAQATHFNTLGRIIGWTIGGLFLWPLWITAIMESMQLPMANENLDTDFRSKSFNKSQIIKPFSTTNGLIFFRSNNFKNNFSFTLIDSETNEKLIFSSSNMINNLKNI